MISRLKKHLMRSVCRSTAFSWAVRLADAMPYRGAPLLRVLTYHRIDEVDARLDLDPSLISATPAQFATQVEWLSRDFDLVSLDEVLAAVDQRSSLPKRPVLLTFDDAYLDFETHAWPALRQYSAPATLFVPTAFPGGTLPAFWWDRLYAAVVHSEFRGALQTPFGAVHLTDPGACEAAFRGLKGRLKSLPEEDLLTAVDRICEQCQAPMPGRAVLGWESLKRLAAAGVALVPHTHTHPLLDRIPPEMARAEICRSRDELRQQLGKVAPAFAYPSGHYDERVAGILRDEGFQLAFTTVRGLNDLRSSDLLRLRRANVGRHTPDPLIRFQLTAISRYLNQPVPSHFASPLKNSKSLGATCSSSSLPTPA